MKVEVHFLGQPEILIDHVRLTITQKKIEAMLLYILFNGTCTRDELVAIFWCDCDEEGARGNLAQQPVQNKKSDWERLPAYRREVLYQFKP